MTDFLCEVLGYDKYEDLNLQEHDVREAAVIELGGYGVRPSDVV